MNTESDNMHALLQISKHLQTPSKFQGAKKSIVSRFVFWRIWRVPQLRSRWANHTIMTMQWTKPLFKKSKTIKFEILLLLLGMNWLPYVFGACALRHKTSYPHSLPIQQSTHDTLQHSQCHNTVQCTSKVNETKKWLISNNWLLITSSFFLQRWNNISTSIGHPVEWPHRRSHHAATHLSGPLFVIVGGLNQSGHTLNEMWLCDTTTKLWKTVLLLVTVLCVHKHTND